MATTAVAAIAATQEIVSRENDRRAFAVIVLTFH
jgi:hypothetical protein